MEIDKVQALEIIYDEMRSNGVHGGMSQRMI